MKRFKVTVVLMTTLALYACGGSKGHGGRGGPGNPMAGTPSQEFSDLVMRLLGLQAADTLEPEDINPKRWSFRVDDNAAAFDHLF